MLLCIFYFLLFEVDLCQSKVQLGTTGLALDPVLLFQLVDEFFFFFLRDEFVQDQGAAEVIDLCLWRECDHILLLFLLLCQWSHVYELFAVLVVATGRAKADAGASARLFHY